MLSAAAILLIFAVARITRALVFDKFPPAQWIRDKWDSKTADSGWNELFHCSFCMGIWVALPFVVITAGLTFGWAVFLTLAGLWWVFLAWMAVGYLAGIIVATEWG